MNRRWAPAPGSAPQRPGYQRGTRTQNNRRNGPGQQGPQQSGSRGAKTQVPGNRRQYPPYPAQPIVPMGGQMIPTPDMLAMPEPLSPGRLAHASPEDRKQMLGDALFPLIHAQQPTQSAKITGMILESTEDTTELLHLLENQQLLSEKIEEAVGVLKAHNQYEGIDGNAAVPAASS